MKHYLKFADSKFSKSLNSQCCKNSYQVIAFEFSKIFEIICCQFSKRQRFILRFHPLQNSVAVIQEFVIDCHLKNNTVSMEIYACVVQRSLATLAVAIMSGVTKIQIPGKSNQKEYCKRLTTPLRDYFLQSCVAQAR